MGPAGRHLGAGIQPTALLSETGFAFSLEASLPPNPLKGRIKTHNEEFHRYAAEGGPRKRQRKKLVTRPRRGGRVIPGTSPQFRQRTVFRRKWYEHEKLPLTEHVLHRSSGCILSTFTARAGVSYCSVFLIEMRKLISKRFVTCADSHRKRERQEFQESWIPEPV